MKHVRNASETCLEHVLIETIKILLNWKTSEMKKVWIETCLNGNSSELKQVWIKTNINRHIWIEIPLNCNTFELKHVSNTSLLKTSETCLDYNLSQLKHLIQVWKRSTPSEHTQSFWRGVYFSMLQLLFLFWLIFLSALLQTHTFDLACVFSITHTNTLTHCVHVCTVAIQQWLQEHMAV